MSCRKLLALLAAQGARIERGTRHYLVYDQAGSSIVAAMPLTGSTSSPHAYLNVLSQLRRAGYSVPRR